jgi:hypothetical protein
MGLILYSLVSLPESSTITDFSPHPAISFFSPCYLTQSKLLYILFPFLIFFSNTRLAISPRNFYLFHFLLNFSA